MDKNKKTMTPATSRYTDWNTNSEYHSLRHNEAASQVSAYLEPYLKSFTDLYNLTEYSIADFACGQGSIAREVLSLFSRRSHKVSRFGLLDVAPDNLPLAVKKASEANPGGSNSTRIETFKLNGSDLSDYRGEKFDFVYCWDAMVHFDILDVAGYLKSFGSLCRGRALFHHSNYDHVTKDISANPHWRNFMTDKVFNQLCVSREPLIKKPSTKTSSRWIKKWERAEGRKGLRQQSGG